MPGDFITIVALQSLGVQPSRDSEANFYGNVIRKHDSAVAPQKPVSGGSLEGTQSRTGVRSFYIDKSAYCDQSGCYSLNLPVLDAASSSISGEPSKTMFAIVAWDSFEQVARGPANKEGRFSFDVPEDIESGDFLLVRWADDGEISLAALVTDGRRISGFGFGSSGPSPSIANVSIEAGLKR